MSPTIRRLMKEAAELSESSPFPSPHFCAHPVSDSNLFDWHFTLAGPPAPSPYAGGIYHGRIVLPPTYPLRPPSFRFLTPSGRFEVNREICLSISGHHEETWQPAWGIRTALTAIRSFMDGDAKGQIGGLDAPEDVRRMWAQKSRLWSCECMSGKTNEQILNEWRAICAQKGISVDDQDRETVPEELRMSYKKPSDEGHSQSLANSTNRNEESSALSSEDDGNSAPTISPAHQEPSSSTLITTSILGPQVPPSSESNTSPTTLRPTPTTTSTVTSNNNTMSRPLNTQTNSSQDGSWLDRAIVGVLIALIFMIMRRIAASEDI
ncbi:hypothetical protein EYB26_002331 [Talaromyces marneffei]|uniref:uncharacterized protein n=1 Tax=Talaromyces marneffei TaxID=37727 RepID=UPI0012A98B41|nr:uncharacterized protein EYB26_002331 [Talaromyces marneffei]QGA14675.1 hypothetical protein EYB26_002331 [Talaromyces marneffei]